MIFYEITSSNRRFDDEIPYFMVFHDEIPPFGGILTQNHEIR